MALVKCKKDKNGIYDFTDLLNRTCENFVEEIKWRVAFSTEFHEKFPDEKFEVILDIEEYRIPKVYIKKKDSLEIYKYYSKDLSENITIQQHEFKTIANMFDDKLIK